MLDADTGRTMSQEIIRGQTAAPRVEAQCAATWAVFETTGASFDSVRRAQFDVLRNYIKSCNIPMTAPVLMSKLGNVYSMHFKIDEPHAGKAVDAPGIRIVHTPVRSMKVHAFNGFFVYETDARIQQELQKIRESGVAIEDGNLFIVQYNSPFAWWRHNEIWISQ